MLNGILIMGAACGVFAVVFETCLAWLCAALLRIARTSILRSIRLVALELLLPFPVASVIGYAVACIVGGSQGFYAGLTTALAFSGYLFLVVARQVYETSYARAALFSAAFLAANVLIVLVVSFSPTVGELRYAFISWPK